MKIAVYAICKNEAAFFDRWLASCKDADYIHITDTGSNEEMLMALANTELSNFHYNSITVKPWRFDEPRNFSLHSLPADIDVCICLDLDEVLVPGWRKIIEDNWLAGIDRLRYNYIWSWDNGRPGVTYHADKIHVRHGMRWVNPVHEVLVKDGRLPAEQQHFIQDTLIEHHPDDSKSRSSYLPLLELAVKENPNNDRNSHYLAREYLFAQYYEEAAREFERHLSLPTALWASERAASMRYLGDCYWALNDRNKAITWFKKAIAEAPYEREAYVALAQAYRANQDWEGVIKNCKAALAITERPNTYINQPQAWSNWPELMLNEALTFKSMEI